jgi:hypothetical protein
MGLNLLLSGLFGSDGNWNSYGFLVGGAMEFAAGPRVDVNAGMSFERMHSTVGPVTVASLIDLTAARNADLARWPRQPAAVGREGRGGRA